MEPDRPLRRDRLSTRLIRVVLLSAMLIGAVLSVAQILVDAGAESEQLDRSSTQALVALRRAAAEAVYEIDTDLAAQVLDGLSAYPGVYQADIVMFPDTRLARREGALQRSRWRGITDRLFGVSRSYVERLADPRGGEPLGELRVEVDTFVAGRAFIGRALVALGVGLIWASLLGIVVLAVVHRFLTRPLERLAGALAGAGGNAPEAASIPVPSGHERDELGRLTQAMNGLLAAIRDSLARRAEAEARASYLQQFDDLTGLPNRQLFMTRLGHAVATASTRGEPLAVLLIDLRGLRELNTLYGRALGDDVLREVARRLESLTGGAAFLARLVEDKFALLLRDGASRDAVENALQRVRDDLSRPLQLPVGQFALAVWAGAALYPEDAANAEILLQSAESGLALAKREGGEAAGFYDAARDHESSTRRRLSLDLRRPEVCDELELVFEPLVAAREGRVLGLEALLRWRHPEFGLLRPGSFIRLAEENGAIQGLGDWVLQHACAKAMAWRLGSRDAVAVSVNVSGAQLHERHLDARVAAVLEATGLPPAALELEITETAIVDNIKYAAETLRRLRELGVSIAIDDFGTGHASLGYLKQLPVTKLKIDMSFVRDVLTDSNDATIVRAIVGLGHSLGLLVTAEGVETAAQRRFLEDIGCDLLQGALFGCGMSEVDALAYVRRYGGPARRLQVL